MQACTFWRQIQKKGGRCGQSQKCQEPKVWLATNLQGERQPSLLSPMSANNYVNHLREGIIAAHHINILALAPARLTYKAIFGCYM